MAELLKIQPIAPQIATGQVRIQPPAASHIGRGLTRLGTEMMRLQEHEQEQENIYRIESQINRLRDVDSDLLYGEKGALNLKGENVFGMGEPFVEAYGRQYEERIRALESELGNDTQKQRFRVVADKLRSQFGRRLQVHEAEQAMAARDSAFKGTIATETEAIARAVDNVDFNTSRDQIDFAIARVKGTARNYYDNELGLGGERTEAEVLKLESSMHSQVVAGYLRNRDPLSGRAYFETNKDRMTAEHRDQIANYIDARMKEIDRERDQEEKARVDAVNREILVASEAPNARLSDIRREVLSRSDIPFAAQKFWVDRLNDMIEKKNQPGPDPYMKSDGRTLATVMQGVLNNPDEWTTEKVLNYMGRGLSVTHALQAAGKLKQLRAELEKSPRGSDPLQNAIKSLDYYRDQKIFIPAEKLEAQDNKYTPEDLLQNDLTMQRLTDKLVERAGKNEDPQAVLNELMQPFFEQKVKTFFEKMTLQDEPARKRQAERIEARQFLARAGLPINDENINQTIEHLRKKKAGQAQPAVRAEY